VLTLRRMIGLAFTLAALLPALYLAYNQARSQQTGNGDALKLGELASRLLEPEQLEKVAQAVDQVSGRVLAKDSWDGTQPLRCGGNSQLTLTGVTARLPGRTAVSAEVNCRLRLVDCTIEAWEGIAVGGNAEVILERSRIETKGVAVDISGNGRLELVDSTIDAEQIAVRGAGNAHVLLGSGHLSGKQQALVLKGGARGELREAEIDGAVVVRAGRLEGWPRR
jgi:hypothetical protein